MPGYLYILHFDEPLHHAKHYSGSTKNLRQRLVAHASGAGSKLTKWLADHGLNWRLGAVATAPGNKLRAIERELKARKNACDFCAICRNTPFKVPGTLPIDLDLCQFATDSQSLRGERPEFTIQVSTKGDRECLERIRWLMQDEREALGFIPIGDASGALAAIDRGRFLIVRQKHTVVGYLMWTKDDSTSQVNIHQLTIDDPYRLYGLGKQTVATLEALLPHYTLHARVRSELPANEFWEAIGFTRGVERENEGSLSKCNNWYKAPMKGYTP